MSNCANQLPPGGGEIDKIPPHIEEIYPPEGTINFNEDYFEIGFSEYVEKRSVKEAIFISPAVEGELELDWSGKFVRVYFPDTLKQNITYVVTIGTDVVDYNNKNNMAEAYSFTFSTGPEIDKRIITGKVFDEKPQGVLLFAYLLKNGNPNPLEVKPDYISQASANGDYKLAGLSAGNYRIFAVRDELRDLLFQPDQDQIGFPSKDVKLEEADSLFTGLDFILTKIDTVKPRLLTATMTDRDHILLNFSEELNHETFFPKNFFLIDSTANRKVEMLYAFKGNTKPSEMVVVPSETLPIQNTVYLFVDSIKDVNGNVFTNDFVQVTLSDKPDTTKIELFNSTPAEGSKDVDFLSSNYNFRFNDAFNYNLALTGVKFTDTSQMKIPFDIKFPDNASINITPLIRLEASKEYIIGIDFSKLRDKSGNFTDTIYKYEFKTISGLDFTGVNGILDYPGEKKNLQLELHSLDKAEKKYSISPRENKQFSFERILPGKYLLFAYADADSNKQFSEGGITPFKFSEEFTFHSDTLNLRARWIETDVRFKINK
ncbi:MAG: Ig-like domain-containing protein [Ignavibacteriaceae bacterium]|nr:Ig-like domain-containing protein [Ignavibacteriaceae bacterium]